MKVTPGSRGILAQGWPVGKHSVSEKACRSVGNFAVVFAVALGVGTKTPNHS